MGMGAGACYGWVIGYDDLKKICLKEIDNIEGSEEFEDWGEVSRGFELNELPDIFEKSVENLIGQFFSNTGLTLSLGFYNVDDGDIYDEVDSHEGCVFFVDGMVSLTLTPAGEKFKEVVRERLWTQYG